MTTLRRDVETDGRHARVAFTDDWLADALRRDFTINALYLRCRGKILRLCNGYRDILERKVSFVGDPRERIEEDYLRILRFFRFHAQYGKGRSTRRASRPAAARKGLARICRPNALRPGGSCCWPAGPPPSSMLALTANLAAVLGAFVTIRRAMVAAMLGRETPDAMLRLAALTRASPRRAQGRAQARQCRWRRLLALNAASASRRRCPSPSARSCSTGSHGTVARCRAAALGALAGAGRQPEWKRPSEACGAMGGAPLPGDRRRSPGARLRARTGGRADLAGARGLVVRAGLRARQGGDASTRSRR